jgi:hypothetical protein
MQERSLLVVAVLFAIMMFPSFAMAQDTDRTDELKKLVEEARAAFGDEDFETAIDRLLAAYRIEPNARLLYNTARSYEELDDCRRALVYYRAFTQHEGAEDNLASKAKKKLARSDRCAAYSPSLAGRLTVTSEPAGATIIVDGEEKGATPKEIAGLPSGEHTIAVELDGYRTASSTIDMGAGEDRKISVKLVEAPAEQTDSSELMGDSTGGTGSDVAAGKQADTGGDSTAGVSVPAIALAGAGVVGLGLGAYIDLVAIPNTDDERAQFAPDSARYQELTDKRNGQVTTALVGYIGGGALLAAGATWLILDLTGATGGSARIQPVGAPSENGFVGGLRIEF